jgi:exopolysaccharide production protein ExoY
MEEIDHLTAPTVNISEVIKYEIKHIPVKRTFDIIFSLLVLILCSPLFAILATLIRLTSPGKALYSQERVGRGGKSFRCYKFRTMFLDADKRLHDILKNDSLKKLEWEQSHKLKNDPRVTKIGSFLRKTSLDELPQFWNVLIGDLSVVGPRPVVQEEITKHFGMKAAKILSVRPGITGIWQVSGRSDISYSKRIQLDEKYVDTHSIALDLKLIVKTIPSIVTSKGAY